MKQKQKQKDRRCERKGASRKTKCPRDHERRWPAVSSAAVSGLSGFSQSVGCPVRSATGTAVCLKGSPVKQRAPPAARHSAK